jgi:hypothetical protein
MNKVVLDELLRVLLERIGIREENGFRGMKTSTTSREERK